jgi:ferredoxin
VARVEALHTMCIGNKVCTELVPEVFQLDKYGCVDIPDSDVEKSMLPRVRDAVYRCPAKALLIDEG